MQTGWPIREAFRDWIWRDPERRQTLVRQYNEEMNSTRPREYDGSHITFGGMNPAITLREHQKSAIAHVLYGGNTLLAHEVGAGKTFEMVAAAMEAKRLGLCQKSLFVVPNHLTEQWASEFLRLYPSANILVTTKKDFETHNRKKFCARIATGDYDAIIMGHSQFERMKKHGHYCKVCGEYKANEKFSGKGHASHICKSCASLPAEKQAELMTLNRLLNLPWRLSKEQLSWLKNRLKDRRPDVRALAQEQYEMRFPPRHLEDDEFNFFDEESFIE